ncbi:methionine aminopeptidase [Platysternon megacephalum]|uniref:Methionine aminopeptidase n=1 Tax=Platysternon megacephalum TaxID=55544 RepID=A0A4D9DF79_9SAUR|nr:methionine aminopeptidase [Platysternon megacephalum]
MRVTLTDSLTQGLCGRLDIREMDDSSMSPGSVRSLPLLGFTIFLISLHVHRLDSGRIPGALGPSLAPTEASGSAEEGWAPSLSSV